MTQSTENTGSGTGNPFAGFSMEPGAMIKMMEDIYKKTISGITSGSLPKSLPMDPRVFTQALEKVIKSMSDTVKGGTGKMPSDPTAMMKLMEDSFKKVTQSMPDMADPRAFFTTFEKLVKEGPMGKVTSGDTGMKDMMNPGFWFKMGEQTLRQGAQMMQGTRAKETDGNNEAS